VNFKLVPTLDPTERGWSYQLHQPQSIQSIAPSHGLPDDILDLMRHAEDRVTQHHYASGPQGRSLIEGYFARLYSRVSYPYAETFTCSIPEATLVGPLGIAVTDRGEVLAESTLYSSGAGLMLWAIKDLAVHCEGRIAGACVSLLSYAATNYAHWLLDCLPRLMLLDGAQYGDFRVMLPPHAGRFHRESLALLGIGDDRSLIMNQPNIQAERLLISHTAHNPVDPHPAHLIDLRDRLWRSLKVIPNPQRRIYISRAKAVRPIVNEAELLPILSAFGFEIVQPEALSFADQVRLFAESRVVLGAHGAGIHNHIFCGAGATVIELFNPRLWTLSACRSASIVGHTHWHTFVENVGSHLETRVDPARLGSLLNSALES
jgi:hypothetical protein